LREAELKHGRVSMLAVVGMVVAEFVHLPGEAYSNPAPLAAVSQVGPSVMLQIVFGMGAVEYVLNKGKMSSMDMFEVDRAPGDLGFDPMNKMKPNDPDQCVFICRCCCVFAPILVTKQTAIRAGVIFAFKDPR
jgi:hypothetical protein